MAENTFGDAIGELGGLFGRQDDRALFTDQQQFNQDQSQSNPFGFQGAQGGLAFDGQTGSATMTPEQQAILQQTQGGIGGFLQGAQDPNALQAIQPAFQQQQGVLNQQLGSSAFGGLGGLQQQSQGLAQQFGNQAGQGVQDASQGGQQFLFNQGQNFLQQSGNQNQLIQNQLANLNAVAAPGEARARQNAQESIFARTGGATSGGRDEFAQLLARQDTSRAQRELGASQLGLQQQGQLAQQGFQAFNQGSQLFGQNQNAFGQQIQGANQFGSRAAGLEGQQFGQNLQSQGFNQSAGQNRLQNAMNMFGLQEQTAQNRFNTGLAGQGVLDQQQQTSQDLFLGSLGADAERINAQGEFAQANATLASGAQESGGGIGDIIKTGLSVVGMFSDIRLKKNVKQIGTLGPHKWFEWEWNDRAKAIGADKQPTYGVIAQHVIAYAPELIGIEGDYLTVNYGGLYSG